MPVNAFKWKHFAGEIILLNVRWYLKYALSYKNLEEIMAERGIKVDHTTIMRWVHEYSPEIEKKIRKQLRPTNLIRQCNISSVKSQISRSYLGENSISEYQFSHNTQKLNFEFTANSQHCL